MNPNTLDLFLESEDDADFVQAYDMNIKGFMPEEIVDTIIRCLDLAEFLGIDIDYFIEKKMRYNSLRKHKHGKNY